MSSSQMPDFKLEVVRIPVSDVDRSKRFYLGLGWREDADFSVGDHFRVVQLTPPNSPCSIHFGKGLPPKAAGPVQGTYLVVSDMEAARAALKARGVNVSEPYHLDANWAPQPGPDPDRRTYNTYATFSDPDGNGWVLQEVSTRLPGRTW